jgi:hypothetical protein
LRDLTRSMLSFTWAMSVFGLAQAGNLLSPRRAAAAFDQVTRNTADQLGAVTRPAFNVGDNLQRGLVDLAFSVFGLDGSGCSSCSPRRQQTPRQSSGWGPMPPPPSA